MLDDDLLENYQQFVDEILDTGEVWGLVEGDGWAMCDSEQNENQAVIPFWSAREYAAVHSAGDWQAYEPKKIQLSEFVEAWLPGMQQDKLLLGPNWNEQLEGLEIEPSELISMFK